MDLGAVCYDDMNLTEFTIRRSQWRALVITVSFRESFNNNGQFPGGL